VRALALAAEWGVAGLLGLLAFEILLRLLGLAVPHPADDPSQGFFPFVPILRPLADDWVEVVDAPTALGRPQFNVQRFPRASREDEVRILVVGGSLVYGWPYDDRVSFPRLLEIGLAATRPGVRWRVLNFGAPGWGTTRIRRIADELAVLDADVVVLAAGHNEMLEWATWRQVAERPGIRTLTWLVANSRLAAALASLVRQTSTATLQGPGALPLVDETSREALVLRYVENLSDTIERFRGAGARVYLATLPANLRDTAPFTLDAPGEPEGAADPKAVRRYREILSLLSRGSPEEALARCRTLIASQPGSARARYVCARALEDARAAAGSRIAAAYRQALDLDRRPLRAFGALNRSVREIARASGAGLVDLDAALSEVSRNGVPGDALFVDNCHVNLRGAALMATAVARALAADNWLPADASWEAPFQRAINGHAADLTLPRDLERQALTFLQFYYEARSEAPLERDRLDEIRSRLSHTETGSH
jgi:lysophospholipase L1-like esterase